MNIKQFAEVMDGISTFVAHVTGMKSALMAAGWTEPAAEQLVINAIRGGAE